MQARPEEFEQDCIVPLHTDSLHDLAGPINQISTMFDLLLKRYRKQPGGEEEVILKLIQASTARLQKLMTGLRNYTHVMGSTWEFRACEGNAIMANALTTLDPVIRDSAAEVTHDNLPRIDCDPNHLACAFINLIDNAIKFRAEARPQIRISCARQNADLLISVRDNGIGIDPRHWEAIFHMFKRINGDRYDGCGAGLAITRRIIEQHGGRIWLESQPGHGSTFFFTVPAG